MLYGYSYTAHIQTLIGEMIDQCEHTQSNKFNIATAVSRKWVPSSDCRPCHTVILTWSSDQLPVADTIIHDLNDHPKTKGFLTHERLDFAFISLERQMCSTSSKLHRYG